MADDDDDDEEEEEAEAVDLRHAIGFFFIHVITLFLLCNLTCSLLHARDAVMVAMVTSSLIFASDECHHPLHLPRLVVVAAPRRVFCIPTENFEKKNGEQSKKHVRAVFVNSLSLSILSLSLQRVVFFFVRAGLFS